MKEDGRLRVALVIPHLVRGGAERQLAELAARAGEHGVEPHVFCLDRDDRPFGPWIRERGVSVTAIPRARSFDLGRALALAGHLRRGGFDLVHSFLGNSNAYAFLAARLAGAPVFVASMRNADFPRDRLRRVIDSFVLRRSSLVVVNAEAVRAFAVKRYGAAPDRVALVYNGVDLERFRPAPSRRREAERIGTIGSLTAKKNPALYAALSRVMRARFPGIRCLHVGEGPLRAEVESRGAGALEVLGSSDAPERFLADLDVFVLTSEHEGCPNVLVEAMACGLPSVTTDAGGAREVVREGVTGFVVARGDLDALVDRVSRLLADAALRERMARAARAEAEERFGAARMAAEMAAVYRRSIESAEARAA
jgi:glycosyltransferase involved in cell wall biosynthesis